LNFPHSVATSTRKITGATPNAKASSDGGSFSKKTGAKAAKVAKKKSEKELQQQPGKHLRQDTTEGTTNASSTNVKRGYDI
jgi:hypothetical protein